MEDENEVGHRINAKKQRQRVRSGAGLVLGAEERGGQGIRESCHAFVPCFCCDATHPTPALFFPAVACLPASNACPNLCALICWHCLQEYEEWKLRMLAEAKGTGSLGGSKKGQQLTEKKLRQATLSFAPAAPAAEAAGAADQSAGGATAEASGSKREPLTLAAVGGAKSKGQAADLNLAGAAKHGSKASK